MARKGRAMARKERAMARYLRSRGAAVLKGCGLYGVSCTAASACTAVGTLGPLVAFFGVDVPLADQRP